MRCRSCGATFEPSSYPHTPDAQLDQHRRADVARTICDSCVETVRRAGDLLAGLAILDMARGAVERR